MTKRMTKEVKEIEDYLDGTSDEILAAKGLKPAFPFSERERFIQIMTVMITSETAKKIPRDARRSILDYLRKKHCPSVTDDIWHEISETINHNQKVFIGSMLKNTELSMGLEASTICNNCGYVAPSDEVIA